MSEPSSFERLESGLLGSGVVSLPVVLVVEVRVGPVRRESVGGTYPALSVVVSGTGGLPTGNAADWRVWT